MTNQVKEEPRTVRFGRRQSRGMILGFSTPRVVAVGVGIGVLILSMVGAGVGGAFMLSPLWLGVSSTAFIRWGKRPLAEMVPVGVHFGSRVVSRQDRYLARVSRPRPAGTMGLPGDACSLRFLADSSGAVMVHDPHAQTLTSIVRVNHPAFVLLGPNEQGQRVAAWSRVLAQVGQSRSICRLQMLESALPDGGRGIQDWWQAERSASAPSWAAEQYGQLMGSATEATAAHRSLVAIALDMKANARRIREAGRGVIGAAALLRQEMRAMEEALNRASLRPDGWLADHELATLIRTSYDPVSTTRLDYWDVGRNLSEAGPVGIHESWDHLRHDSGFSTVLWISEWPRIDMPAWFLHSIVFEPDVRRTLSIVASPMSTERAMQEIRRQKVEYLSDARQKEKIGQLADLADSQEYQDLLDRERALVSGHTDVRFSGFLTVTATTKEQLDAAVAAVERAALQAVCETRVLFGQQSQAFAAAALPLARAVH